MFCPHCGMELFENAKFCHKCGQRVEAASSGPPPPPPPTLGTPRMEPAPFAGNTPYPSSDYLELESKITSSFWASIAVTFFCCVIGGVIGIIYSSQAKTALAKGDIDGAIRANNTATRWCWFSALSFVGIIVIGVVASILSLLAIQ